MGLEDFIGQVPKGVRKHIPDRKAFAANMASGAATMYVTWNLTDVISHSSGGAEEAVLAGLIGWGVGRLTHFPAVYLAYAKDETVEGPAELAFADTIANGGLALVAKAPEYAISFAVMALTGMPGKEAQMLSERITSVPKFFGYAKLTDYLSSQEGIVRRVVVRAAKLLPAKPSDKLEGYMRNERLFSPRAHYALPPTLAFL